MASVQLAKQIAQLRAEVTEVMRVGDDAGPRFEPDPPAPTIPGARIPHPSPRTSAWPSM